MTTSSTGSARIEPSDTTARPVSSSLRKSTSSISSRDLVDLQARLVDELERVGAG